MNKDFNKNSTAHKAAGYVAITGALSMLTGAALWGGSGSEDLWQSLYHNEMSAYLQSLPAAKKMLVANTFFWTFGVLMMGIALRYAADQSSDRRMASTIAKVSLNTALPLAIVSFIIMLSLATTISGDIDEGTLQLGTLIGWMGVRMDDIATILVVGVGPLFISAAGNKLWVPAWLHIWGYLAGIAGFLSVLTLVFNLDPGLGFILIPVGVLWVIAMGIVLLKLKKSV